MNKEQFFTSIQGKTVTFCGIGRSHMPLIRLFQEKGALVSARDKRSLEELGDNGKALQEWGVQLILGENYLEDLREDIIFRTPGMKYHLPQLEAARKRGAAVTSEMEVFFQLCPCKIYAVTGSDGKTTTTSIIAELLKAQGKTVHLGGNIGKPLLPEIESIQPEDCAVVELSSFQLISMRESPDVAVVTNLSPNHLDVHKDMQEYIDAKKNILLHQGAFSRTVLNAGNEITASFAPQVRGDCWMFRRGGPGSLQLPGQEPFLAVMDSLKLLGAPGEELIHYSFGFTEHRVGEDGRGRGVHTAQAGESLWDYARRYEKTMEEMIAANPHIRDIAVLEDGEEVRVP